MNLTIKFSKPEIKSVFDWQLFQEVNVINDDNEVIAKAELELITLNKHRDALKSYQALEQADEAADWELPLNLFFKGQNLSADLCQQLAITPNIKKAQKHIMLEAISVLPAFRNQGVAKFLLSEIAKEHNKVQSITVMSMPMHLFVDAEQCEQQSDKAYYQQLNLESDAGNKNSLLDFFKANHFIEYTVDEQLLNEPLIFDLLITSPEKLILND